MQIIFLFLALFQSTAVLAVDLGCEKIVIEGSKLSDLVAQARESVTAACGPLAHPNTNTNAIDDLAEAAEGCTAAAHNGRAQAEPFLEKWKAACTVLHTEAQTMADMCRSLRSFEKRSILSLGELKVFKAGKPWVSKIRLNHYTNLLGSLKKGLSVLTAYVNDRGGEKKRRQSARADVHSAAAALKLDAAAANKEPEMIYLAAKADYLACAADPACASSERAQDLLKKKRGALLDFSAAAHLCGKVEDISANMTETQLTKADVSLERLHQGPAIVKVIAEIDAKVAAGRAQLDTHQAALAPALAATPEPEYAAPEQPQPDLATLEKAGSYKISFYWVAEEKDLGEPLTNTIRDRKGNEIAKVSRRFFHDELLLEGTGKLLNGQTVNVVDHNDWKATFEVMGEATPFGYGVSKKFPLVPFKAVAVDPKQIPIGSELFVPQFFGMKYEDQHGVDRLHDGRVYAVDIGDAIQGGRIDVFTSIGDQSYFYAAHGLKTMEPIDVYFVKKAEKKP